MKKKGHTPSLMCSSPQESDCPMQLETGVVGEEKETEDLGDFEG